MDYSFLVRLRKFLPEPLLRAILTTAFAGYKRFGNHGPEVNRWRRPTVSGLMGAIVVGLAAVGLTAYLTDVASAYQWGKLARMAVHTLLGYVVLGTGLIARAWHEERLRYPHQRAPRWLPLLLCDAPDDSPARLPQAVTHAPTGLTSSTLHKVRFQTRQAARARGFSPTRVSDLLTAVGEASMNAVVHGGKNARPGDEPGKAEVWASETSVQVWVTDHGKGIA